MARAIVIDAEKRELRYIEIPDGSNSLPILRDIVDGWISVAYTWNDKDVLYVDDEGLMKGREHYFRLFDRTDGQPLAGNGVILGEEVIDEEGDFVNYLDTRLTIEFLSSRVQFLTKQQAIAWFKGNASEPMITVTTIDADKIKTEVIARYAILIPEDDDD